MHCRLGSVNLLQLVFPGERNPNFPWEKSQWANTIVNFLIFFNSVAAALFLLIFPEGKLVLSRKHSFKWNNTVWNIIMQLLSPPSPETYSCSCPCHHSHHHNNPGHLSYRFVSRCGLAVRRLAGKQKDLGSIRFRSPFSSKIVVYGHCLVTLPTQLMKHENGSQNCPPSCRIILVVTV